MSRKIYPVRYLYQSGGLSEEVPSLSLPLSIYLSLSRSMCEQMPKQYIHIASTNKISLSADLSFYLIFCLIWLTRSKTPCPGAMGERILNVSDAWMTAQSHNQMGWVWSYWAQDNGVAESFHHTCRSHPDSNVISAPPTPQSAKCDKTIIFISKVVGDVLGLTCVMTVTAGTTNAV